MSIKTNDSLFRIAHRVIFTLILFVSSVALFSQNVVKGIVVDRQKQPLPGVSVILKSSAKTNTVTDIDGNFSLKVSDELPVTLVFTFLGYRTQEVDVYDANEPLDITLSDNVNVLNEVVVTALGINREKKSLGYATQEIKNEALEGNKETNLLNGLSGKLAGVRITNSQGDMGSSRIVIRGETSISGNNTPLFVVDGIPVNNSQYSVGGATRDFRNAIADLNPSDIESMSILKGPNAAALYGSFAAHGVVLITTKSGKGKKGLGVTVNSGISFSRVTTLPEFQDVFGQGASGKFSYVDGKGGGVNDGVDESWGPKMDGRLIPQFFSNGEAVPFVAHPDNVKDFFDTGVTFENGIAIAGSDEKYDFRLGVNYQDQKGTVPNTQLKKTNFSFNSNYQLTKRVKIGATANYIVTDTPNLPGGPSGNRAAGVMLQFLWFGRQVDTQELKKDWTNNWNNSYYSNPYWRANYNTVEQNRNRIIGDIHADVNIIDGLDFRFRTGTDYYNDSRKYKIKYGTNGTPYGSYSEDRYTVNENNTDAMLLYKKDLNSNFNIDALVGFNIRNRTLENNYQQAPRLAVPDLYTLSNSRDNLISTSLRNRSRTYGVYASAQVGYKNYAFVNLTARNDWASSLPRNNRSFFYPSINASLVLSEALDIKSSVLDFLKIRGGWSEVGSEANLQDIKNFYLINNVYSSETNFQGNPILTSSKIKNNPNLKPETTRSTEIGAEIGLFGNRVHLDVAVYNSNSINQILPVKTSAASEYTTQILNAGEVNNKGLEVQLDLVPVEVKNFKWNIGLNYATNKSEVKILDDAGKLSSFEIGASGTTQVLASVGQAYGALFGSVYQRDDAGNIVVDSKGLPVKDSQNKVMGHYTPKWTGGLSNTFTYKNIELSALIDASIGGKIYSGTNRTGIYTGVLKSTLPGRDADHGGLYYYVDGSTKVLAPNGIAPGGQTVYEDGIIVDGVTADGQKNTTIASAQDYYKSLYNISEAFTYKASYIKFRELKVTYTFARSLVKKIGLQGASISAVGRNLFFIYKDAPNIDPEVALNTGNAQGIESLSLPTTRTYGFNVNLKF